MRKAELKGKQKKGKKAGRTSRIYVKKEVPTVTLKKQRVTDAM